MMKNVSLFALFLLFAVGGLFAQQQTFVLYDASCMLRVNYEQAIAQQPRMDYFAYQIPLANGNKLILETGVEGSVRQNYLPPNYLSCNDPRLNADFADQINGNRTKVFMLIPEGNDYLIQPVSMGAILARQGNLLTYVSPLASFQFDTRNVIIGENLAFNNNNAKVFFEGRDGSICGGTYLIRQLMPRNAYPVIDYKINPELGVMERRLGSDGTTTVGGVVLARTVNQTPVANYLAASCGGQPTTGGPVTYNSGPGTYSGEIVPPQGYIPPGGVIVPNTVPQQGNVTPQQVAVQATTPPVQQAAPIHSVAKGETLFGISRRYQVSVDQIKEWNNLRGNTINVGQDLRVGTPVMGAVAANTPTGNPITTSPPPVMTNRGTVANSNVGAPQQTPYGNVAPAPGVPISPADQQHIVQAGETVASVALKYGYTEAKFREINGLGANEYLRIGQRLKISSCNCPAVSQGAGTQPAAGASVNTYGGGVVVPQSYQPPVATTFQTGTPVGPTAATANTNNFQQPRSVPAFGQSPAPSLSSPPAFGSPAPNQYNSPVTQPQAFQQPTTPSTNTGNTIDNNPGFGTQPQGQVIPNVFRAPAGQSMNTLEGGNSPIVGNNANSTINNGQIFSGGQNDNSAARTNTRAVHVVQQGESLNTIAQRYGLSIDQLRTLNDLRRTDVIIPFQRLYIN